MKRNSYVLIRKGIYSTRIFTFLVLFIATILLHSCVPLPDDEDKNLGPDNTTSEYPWEGELEKFVINSEVGIKLNDESGEAGTAFASFPSTAVRKTRWEFGVRLIFNPSSENYARFYLASSSKTLSGDLDGYFVQIGGINDNICLYQQQGSTRKLMSASAELMKGVNTPKVLVKVECDANGYWTLQTRLESEKEYTKLTQVKNVNFTKSSYCGVYCCYTKSRSKGFIFHHIQLYDDIETTTKPEEPNLPDNPNIPDNSESPELPSVVEKMLVFNEVMYDNSSDGAEYIELYNPADAVVSISSLRLLRYVDDPVSGKTINKTTVVLQQDEIGTPFKVAPKGYLCLTKSAAAVIKKHNVSNKSTIVGVSKFPQIANEGGHLAIMTNEKESRLIDKCSYFDYMHSIGNKRNQGISLEKKSPELDAAKIINWRSSQATSGGTPGTKNTQ